MVGNTPFSPKGGKGDIVRLGGVRIRRTPGRARTIRLVGE
jgi:hypothetical protein